MYYSTAYFDAAYNDGIPALFGYFSIISGLSSYIIASAIGHPRDFHVLLVFAACIWLANYLLQRIYMVEIKNQIDWHYNRNLPKQKIFTVEVPIINHQQKVTINPDYVPDTNYQLHEKQFSARIEEIERISSDLDT